MTNAMNADGCGITKMTTARIVEVLILLISMTKHVNAMNVLREATH